MFENLSENFVYIYALALYICIFIQHRYMMIYVYGPWAACQFAEVLAKTGAD